MEFRILGPLEVRDDAGTLVSFSPTASRLLAMLLLEPGRVVTVARLSRGLWPGPAPATAKRQVQNNLAKVRRVVGSQRLVPVSEGYRLDLSGARLDAVEFQALADRARRDATAGMPDTAVRRFRAALALWRGRPLAGLTGSLVIAGVKRWQEYRLSVIDELAELELSLRRPESIAVDLRRVLDENPYRQRSVAQLMSALHQQGRTAEALELFEYVRARLAEDLGLDPDAALRRRYAEITSGQPRPGAPKTSVTGPVPGQLPAKPAGFVGRARAQASLTEQFEDVGAARACVVTGAAGTGKTALAVHWGHRMRERFPDGQLYINLRGFDGGEAVSSADALGRFIRALQPRGEPVPSDGDEAAERYRSLTEGRRLLVVLDNALHAEHIEPLLPVDGFAVITSRNQLSELVATGTVTALPLTPMAAAEAAELLVTASGVDRLRSEPETTDRIADLCGQLPLALRIAAALISIDPPLDPADFAARLANQDRLDLLAIDGDPQAAVSAALEQSYRVLPSSARSLLCALALIPGEDFPLALALELGVAGDVDRLENSHLIERFRPDRFRLHDLTREFARAKTHGPGFAALHSETARVAIAWYGRHRHDLTGLDYPNVAAAVDAWRHHPQYWQLIHAVIAFLRTGQDITFVADDVDAQLQLAHETADTAAIQAMYNAKANLCYYAGDSDGDIRFSRLALEAGPDPDGFYHYAYGTALHDPVQGQFYLLEALKIATRAHNRMIELSSICSLGNQYRVAGQYDEAETILRSADPATTAKPTGPIECNIILAKANVDNARQRPRAAISTLQPLLDSLDALEPSVQAWALAFYARAEHAIGESTEAVIALQDALERGRHCYRAQVVAITLTLAEILCDEREFERCLITLKAIDADAISSRQRATFDRLIAKALDR